MKPDPEPQPRNPTACKGRWWRRHFGVPGLLTFAATFVAPAGDLTIHSFDAAGRLTFAMVPEATAYRVEWTTNLSAAVWSSNAPGIPLILGPASGDLVVTVGVAQAACFYRIVALVTNVPAPELAATFATDAQGWLGVDYPFRSHNPNPATSPLPHDGANGNPAGSVRIADVYSETGIAAPAPFLGQKLGFYGGSLTYDIFVRYSDGVSYPAVVLNGAGMSLYFDAPSPPLNEWQRRTVPLTEAGWKVSGTQAVASEAVFKQVLNALVGLYIYTEWHTGSDDTNVDNVHLAPP